VAHTAVLRTERDLSMKFVATGIVILIVAILAARMLHMNLLSWCEQNRTRAVRSKAE
jgi:hypothetical protein